MKKAVKIQKYKARIAGTGEEVIGYIAEGRRHLHSTSSHDHEKSYVILVTEISMPDCSKYGTFIVDPETIEPVICDAPLQEAYSNINKTASNPDCSGTGVNKDLAFSRAVKLLRDLSDLQNGPPLEQHRVEWEETMEEVYDFLNTWCSDVSES